MRWIRMVCALALLCGCSPAPPEETAAAVGRVEISWLEEDGDPVRDPQWGAVLLPDAAAWQEWVDALPADMREARARELATVSLEDSVKVVGVWGQCREVSSIWRTGPGVLEFRITPLDDQPVQCVWAPWRVEVWTVQLEAAGADRDAVELVE